MSNSNVFWKSLELIIRDAREHGWRLGWREDFKEFQTYLLPSGERSKYVACQRTYEGSGWYRIVEHEDGLIVGVCDEGECERKVFKREELARFEIDRKGLAEQIANLLEISRHYVEIGHYSDSFTARLGSLGVKRLPVLLTIQRHAENFEETLRNWFVMNPEPVLFIMPTTRSLSERAQQILNTHRSFVFTLDDNVAVRRDGLAFTADGQDAWLDMRGQITGAIANRSGLRIPSDARWQDLSIRFKDGFTVSVRLGEQTRQLSYAEMGMEDKRSRAPDEQWLLLQRFADEAGVLTWASKSAHAANKKRKERLAKKLKAFFGIEGEPFAYRAEDGGWEAIFHVGLA